MRKKIIDELKLVSDEEATYLNGENVLKNLYTENNIFHVDSDILLQENRLIDARKHTRFVDFPEHSHNFVEMMYVCEGGITHHINNKKIMMEKGDILLMNQGVRHSIEKASWNDVGINFIILPQFFDIPLQMIKEAEKDNELSEFLNSTFRADNISSQYLLFKLKDNHIINNLMENIIESMLGPDDNRLNNIIYQYSMGLLFLELIQNLSKLSEKSSNGFKSIFINAVYQYIDLNYKEAKEKVIAEKYHLSLATASRIISEQTGKTFIDLLQEKRFRTVTVLLQNTNATIEEIAYAVGYTNLSYFY